jgi:phage-related protein
LPGPRVSGGLEPPRRAKILAIIRPLEEYGPTLPFPYSSQVEGKIRELRTHYGEELYRILYFGSVDRTFVLLQAFVKRTKHTPPGEIQIAVERMRRSLAKKPKRRR